ncbi:hypothetical protein N1F89_17465 [Aquibium sp. A9E412]|uniref:hypothetical protein n=1 Tax=Aquibium sp. A9E412 TaxID=2976767 RepID=UPI0025B24AFC|nr:hypothetical protein [Aquibium sp. A9E412]MDN2568016.1 hypothetical protein [Aquibium sp. A9E412]
MLRPALAGLCALVLSAAAAAQDGPTGIAFAEAPEQASGVCTGDTPDVAMACARRRCAEAGARPADCLRVAWCYPAGWSADVFVQHREGPHWHEYLCGWSSRAAALAAAEVTCDAALRPDLIECAVVRLFDEGGNEIAVDP